MDQAASPNTIQIPVKSGSTTVYAIVDACDAWALDYRWHLRGRAEWAYAARSTKSKGKSRKHYLHREVMGLGAFDGLLMVDHMNHDRLDCRRANLRIVTNRENQLNRKGTRKYRRRAVAVGEAA